MSSARLSISTIASQIRSGQTSPTQLAHEPQIRAWVVVDEERAKKAAQQATEELAAGKDRGPLHGVPLGIKDIIDVTGLPTTAGSPLRHHRIALEDAPLVARLREAGAILLGKTVTTEFACYDPPPTRNPWNLQHTPGGSSSGSAAATALGMCWGAIGTQTGGSITRPASFCGVASCKPTLGLISTHGVVPVSHTLDHPGPLAGCVADVALLLEALRPGLLPASLVSGQSLAGPPHLLWLTDFWEQADPDAQQLGEQSYQTLLQAGWQIEQHTTPLGLANVWQMHRRIMAFEAADYHRQPFAEQPESYGPAMHTLLAEGLALPTSAYLEALSFRRQFQAACEELLARTPQTCLVTPAALGAATARLDTTGDPRFNSPWSLAGLPTVSFPCGLTSTGMPISLQWVAAWWHEPWLISGAMLAESLFNIQMPWPTLENQAHNSQNN